MSAVETYKAMIDAAGAQRARIHGERSLSERFDEAGNAQRFRTDPRRALNASLEILAGFIEPGDVLLDVGGGSGRIGLPLALRCRELINVDPSLAMVRGFDECAAEAGIGNVRSIQADWLDAPDIEADVALTVHVTYFVRDIDAFIRKLCVSARRRVIIYINSFPNPNRSDRLFRLVYGEDQARHPSHQELMEVIWELGILPEVRVLPIRGGGGGKPGSKEEAIKQALGGSWLAPSTREDAARVLESHFDELFTLDDDGYRALWQPESRELIITWET